MAVNQEHRAAEPGYALVELAPERPLDATPPAQGTMDALQQQLDGLQSEIAQAHAKLAQVESQARAAVESEDADRVAATWNEKHRLLNRIGELQQHYLDIQQRFQAQLEATLAELQHERAEIERQRSLQDAAWRQMIVSAEGLLQALRQADHTRLQLDGRDRQWHARLEALARRELNALTDAKLEPAPKTQRRAKARPPQAELPAAKRLQEGSGKKWAVYDPETGKLVASLPELLRVLARWYPSLQSDEERLREFLALPNAEPLPWAIREELQQAGYFAGPPADAG
jgi:hypothetical protein